jgi:hypothetical protein
VKVVKAFPPTFPKSHPLFTKYKSRRKYLHNLHKALQNKKHPLQNKKGERVKKKQLFPGGWVKN